MKKDLRFFKPIRVGAIPQLDSPEEVGLINVNGGGMDDGIWYLQHLVSELKAHTASSEEDRRLFATEALQHRNGHREKQPPGELRDDYLRGAGAGRASAEIRVAAEPTCAAGER